VVDIEMKLRAFGLLNELTESPVGIGSGTFFVDEIFILKVNAFVHSRLQTVYLLLERYSHAILSTRVHFQAYLFPGSERASDLE